MPRYEVGEIVRLKRGWTLMVVVEVSGPPNYREFHLCYFGSNEQLTEEQLLEYPKADKVRPIDDIVLWDPDDPDMPKNYHLSKNKNSYRKSEPMTKTLYQTIVADGDQSQYGEKIATDSSGRIVLEMKGSGDVKTFLKSEIKEVIPYTFEAKSLISSGHTCHYSIDDPSAVELGCIIVSKSLNLYMVTKLDSKSKKPKKAFVGTVLTTSQIIDPDAVTE